MIDPQKNVIQAVWSALQGLVLPVYLTLPLLDADDKPIDEYVLISQPTLTPGSGSAACVAWDATLLVSVYTKFVRGNADVEPALDVSSEIMSRLYRQRLDLGEFSMSPCEVQRLSLPQRYDDLNVYVQDNLRLRFEVYAEPTVIVPTPTGKELADYTPAEILAYPRLSELGPLNCPVPVVCPPVKLLADYTPAEILTYPQLSALGPLNCPVVIPKTINDFTVSEVLKYNNLAGLGPLNCPVVRNTKNLVTSFMTYDSDEAVIPIDTNTAGLYKRFTVTGGTADVVLLLSGNPFEADSEDFFRVAAGDAIRVKRTSGNPIITFIGN